MESSPNNTAIFNSVFAEHYRPLCYFARGYVNDVHIIEDIVSEAFIRLWNNMPGIRDEKAVKSYLFRSVKNGCIDHLRAANRGSTISISNKDKLYNTLADLGEDPLDYIITQEDETRLLKAVDGLSEQYRQVIRLTKFEKLKYEEAAAELNVSVNTVKSNLRDAIARLRDKLMTIIIFF
jgi:RNA polymerase sigma-70 factor (ECF subfamily)